MGLVRAAIIYKAGKRRANKKRDRQERSRIEYENWGEHDSTRAMYEYYRKDSDAEREYYANR